MPGNIGKLMRKDVQSLSMLHDEEVPVEVPSLPSRALHAPRGCGNHGYEGALATVCVRCKLWVDVGTLLVIIATIKRPPRKSKTLPKSLWDLLATMKKTWEDRCCACN